MPPLYVWHCPKCEHTEQVVRTVAEIETQPGQDADDAALPECKDGEHGWKRIPAATNFTLMGRGWFKSGGY